MDGRMVEIVAGERSLGRDQVARRRARTRQSAERIDRDDDIAIGRQQPVENVAAEQDVAVDDDGLAIELRARAGERIDFARLGVTGVVYRGNAVESDRLLEIAPDDGQRADTDI